jgi:hypothetical protein
MSDNIDYLKQWLKHRKTSTTYTGFDYIALAEVDGSRNSIFELLAKRIFIYHQDYDAYVEDLMEDLSDLGYPETASDDNRPKDHNTRMGNFGEIVISEYLCSFHDYTIPVFRLRYNANQDSSMKGDDVLAFKFDDDGVSEVVIVEAKTSQKFQTGVVEQALNQLKTVPPRPKSINFILQVLHDQGKFKERQQIKRAFPQNHKKRYVLFLLTGRKPRNPFECIQQDSLKPDNLVAIQMYLDDIVNFMNQLFDYKVTLNGIWTG